MVEKIGHIKNPLSVIAIFAGLAEISGTIVLPILTPTTQASYVWFLMLFPVLLVALFFLILWKKAHVFYAPSDFKTDEAFQNLFQQVGRIAPVADQVTEEGPAPVTEEAPAPLNAQLTDTPSEVESRAIPHTKSPDRSEVTPNQLYQPDFRSRALYAEELAIQKFERDLSISFNRNMALRNQKKIRFDAISAQEPLVAIEVGFTRASSSINTKFDEFVKTVQQFRNSSDADTIKNMRFIYAAVTDKQLTFTRMQEKALQFNSRSDVITLQIQFIAMSVSTLEKELLA